MPYASFAFCGAKNNKQKKISLSLHDPIFVVAELEGDEFGQSMGDVLVFIRTRPAVAGEDIEVILRNPQPFGKLPLGNILLLNDLVQSITQ